MNLTSNYLKSIGFQNHDDCKVLDPPQEEAPAMEDDKLYITAVDFEAANSVHDLDHQEGGKIPVKDNSKTIRMDTTDLDITPE